jgi:hypothetical protein
VDIRSLTAVMAAVAPLSGCGPASDSPTALDTRAQSAPTSPDIAQTPTPTVTQVTAPVATSTHPKAPVVGTALAAIARLTVKGRAPKTGYTRDQFGQSGFDVDRPQRHPAPRPKQQTDAERLQGSGRHPSPDPYTGRSIRFVYGGASEVDIDHLVALSDAWQKGAATGRPARGSPSPTTHSTC